MKERKIEPLVEGSPWQLLDKKVPILGKKFNRNDPLSFTRVAYNPQTRQHWFLTNPEINTLRDLAQNGGWNGEGII